MKTKVTIYRTAFRNRQEWDNFLEDLDIPEEEYDLIDEVELVIDDVRLLA